MISRNDSCGRDSVGGGWAHLSGSLIVYASPASSELGTSVRGACAESCCTHFAVWRLGLGISHLKLTDLMAFQSSEF